MLQWKASYFYMYIFLVLKTNGSISIYFVIKYPGMQIDFTVHFYITVVIYKLYYRH